MKRINYLFIASVVLLSACAGGFKKGDNNIEYKIVKGSGGGKMLEQGNIIEITYKNQIKDTVFGSSNDNGNQIFILDSAKVPKMYFNVFKQVHVGDSVVIRMISDTFFHNNFPAFAKKGQMVFSTFRVLHLFANTQEADSAYAILQQQSQALQMKKYIEQAKKDSIDAIPQLKADNKIIEDYLAKNNLTNVQKGKLGTYVEMIQPGMGPVIDTGMIVKINYTGRTLKGVVFDSNTIDSFKHKEPYPVEIPADINMAQVVHGWIDGIKLLQNGSKAKFFIPSTLAYGKQGRPDKIGTNEILEFDMEVVGVQSKQEAMAEQMKKQQAMMEAQQKMQQQQPQQQPTAPQQGH